MIYEWRTYEAMPGKLANDLNIVIGQAEGRRFRRTAEPRSTCLFDCSDRRLTHALIVTCR